MEVSKNSDAPKRQSLSHTKGNTIRTHYNEDKKSYDYKSK
jgi:hypothetical protein